MPGLKPERQHSCGGRFALAAGPQRALRKIMRSMHGASQAPARWLHSGDVGNRVIEQWARMASNGKLEWLEWVAARQVSRHLPANFLESSRSLRA